MLNKIILFPKKNNKYIEHIIEQRESTEACEIKMLPEVKVNLGKNWWNREFYKEKY